VLRFFPPTAARRASRRGPSDILSHNAEVAELADAPALGAGGRKAVGVRVPSSADLFFEKPTIRWLFCVLQGFLHDFLSRKL
jgi:hypothetical protein